jgi:hypothetical protein
LFRETMERKLQKVYPEGTGKTWKRKGEIARGD